MLLTLVFITTNGFALHLVWGWIMVPTFGAPNINLASAMGIILLAKYFASFNGEPIQDPEKDVIELIIEFMISRPVFLILAGWLISKFI